MSSRLLTSGTDHKDSKTAGDHRDSKAERLSYFHFRIHRVDVEPMLRRNGDFILRRMLDGKRERYVVSVRWGGDIRHFPIMREDGRYCFEARRFENIRRLIEWHINTGTPLTHGSGARIERPVDRMPWELLTKDIETKKKLGKGNFGQVFEAVLTMADGKKQPVAVKTLDKVASEGADKVEAARVEMLEEARTMRGVSGHVNVVEAIGVTIDQEHPMAVMEIVRGNSLEKIVRDLDNPVPLETKIRFAAETAAGLAHIHSKGYLHRDMATRNCLVEMNGGTFGSVKITDFGLARLVGVGGTYKLKKVSQMPVRWSAIESMEKKIWTAKTDVWALGVVAWEIFANGALPYNEVDGMADTLALLKKGKRLEIPSDVPKAVADAMRRSWDVDPAKRPTAEEFAEVCKKAMGKK